MLHGRECWLAFTRQHGRAALRAAGLDAAQVVVLGFRFGSHLVTVHENLRTDEDHEVGLVLFGIAGAEQFAQHRYATKVGYALLAVRQAVRDETAQHDDFAVVRQHLGANGALVRDEVRRAGGGGSQAAGFLFNLHHDGAVVGNLRGDLQNGAHFLTLDGLEGIHGTIAAATAGVGELPGDEGHFLRHFDLGLLVVQRDDGRRGDDVRARVATDGPQDGTEVRAAILEAAYPDGHAGRHAGDGGGVLNGAGDIADAGAADGRDKATGCDVVRGTIENPVDAEVNVLLARDLDDDGFHQHLGAANVETVHDRHERTHDLRRRGDHQSIGFRVGPNSGATFAAAR